MPTWAIELAGISLAASLVIYGLVVLLGPIPKTRLTLLLGGLATTSGFLALVNETVVKIRGWPPLLVSFTVWVASYGAFKHRLALQRSVLASYEARKYGRRSTDD